jgi:hypothetical protein
MEETKADKNKYKLPLEQYIYRNVNIKGLTRLNQIITTMAISYVVPILFFMVVLVLHASAAEKPNRKVISSHIYPVYDSEHQLQSLPDIADYFL